MLLSGFSTAKTLRSKPACGFTLVELVTTLVLIGILGAVAVPRMFDNQAFAQRGYVDEVAAAIRQTQKVAQASGCAATIFITANDYRAFQRDTLATCNTAGAWAQAVPLADGNALRGVAPIDVALSPVTAIQFEADGSISSGVPPVLTVGTFTIAVDAVSGLVRVTP